ncbi:MAG: hypothetical protein NZM25_00445 [Leptospiraceae bacterium]|nr:hypothetical protein [Leptospiraceae bacterium]MDW8306193.1 hypothetical protein [Leptospiraceae bacterium]
MRILLSLFTLSFPLWAHDFGVKAVEIKAVQKGRQISVEFFVKQGYGVQVNAKNVLELYEVKGGGLSPAGPVPKSFLGERKAQWRNFTGEIAKEDTNYFSRLNPVGFSVEPNKSYALEGRFYICSFSNKFCTVQKVSQVVSR